MERWAEDSGNAALMGCELPPDEVLAADQRITAWAKELRRAGLEGGMDVLRARAFLDLLLGKDSRPRQDASGGGDGPGPRLGRARAGRPGHAAAVGGAGGRRGGGRVRRAGDPDRPAGHRDRPRGPARRDRPGSARSIPWLARDLAAAAAQNPKTTWCVTVTDEHGHAVGHGCARPEPKGHGKRAGPGPPGPPGFTFTPGQPGRAARRVRHLAAAHPRTRARPDHHPGIRWPPTPATTGTRPAATTPGPG